MSVKCPKTNITALNGPPDPRRGEAGWQLLELFALRSVEHVEDDCYGLWLYNAYTVRDQWK